VHDRLAAAASLPANGSYLQCSVRLCKQLEFETNMATLSNLYHPCKLRSVF